MQRFLATALSALILASGLVAFGSATAVACSCEGTDVSSLDRADAAFSGTVETIAGTEPRHEDEDAYLATIAVETDLKDNLDDTIHIRSYRDDGGNCGLNLSTGDRIEATIYVDETGSFLVDGCSLAYGDVMDSWSPPTGTGGVAELFVTAYSAPYRFIAYGATGDRLAFAAGQGRTVLMGLCDDDETLVEVVEVGGYAEILVELRSVETLAIGETIPLIVDGETFIASEIACATNPTELAIWGRPTDRPADDRVVIYRDGTWTEADAAEQPRTRSTQVTPDWPSIALSNGEIQMQNGFDRLFALPVAVEVPATAAPVSPPLGAGLSAPVATVEGRSSPAVFWVLGLGVVIIVGLSVYLLRRDRATDTHLS